MSICKMSEKEVIVKTIQINFEPYLLEISFIKCLFQLLLGNLITVFVLWCIMLWNDNITASASCSGVVIQGPCQIFLWCFLKAAWKTVMEWSELLMETRNMQEYWIIPGLLLSLLHKLGITIFMGLTSCCGAVIRRLFFNELQQRSVYNSM